MREAILFPFSQPQNSPTATLQSSDFAELLQSHSFHPPRHELLDDDDGSR